MLLVIHEKDLDDKEQIVVGVADSVENAEKIEADSEDNKDSVQNSTNEVPEADQNSCQKSFENQHCIQGLESATPSGYNGVEHSEF